MRKILPAITGLSCLLGFAAGWLVRGNQDRRFPEAGFRPPPQSIRVLARSSSHDEVRSSSSHSAPPAGVPIVEALERQKIFANSGVNYLNEDGTLSTAAANILGLDSARLQQTNTILTQLKKQIGAHRKAAMEPMEITAEKQRYQIEDFSAAAAATLAKSSAALDPVLGPERRDHLLTTLKDHHEKTFTNFGTGRFEISFQTMGTGLLVNEDRFVPGTTTGSYQKNSYTSEGIPAHLRDLFGEVKPADP